MPVIEPCTKRVRAYRSGELVVDSIRTKLVWDVPHYPSYYFPTADVRAKKLDPAWLYPASPASSAPELAEYVRLRWDAMDTWFEEDEEVFVHAHDPNKRIDMLHGSRHVVVSLNGTTVAETRRPTIVYETGAPVRFYMPKHDARMDLLTPTDKRTGCAYKGFARYWSLTLDGAVHANIAWSYATPLPDSVKVAGLIAFYDEVFDVTVDGVLRAKPVAEE